MIDPLARLMGETSCLSKRDGQLICHAKDPISSGLAIDGFLPPGPFRAHRRRRALAIGAGGSTIALTWHLMRRERGADVPARIIVSNRSRSLASTKSARIHRADRIRRSASTTCSPPTPNDNDAVARGG